MPKKVVTLGEIMLRLSTPDFKRFVQADSFDVTYGGGEANVAAAILLLRPSVLAGAVLLRATLPLSQPPRPELNGKSVLILSGATDALISLDGAKRLATTRVPSLQPQLPLLTMWRARLIARSPRQ